MRLVSLVRTMLSMPSRTVVAMTTKKCKHYDDMYSRVMLTSFLD